MPLYFGADGSNMGGVVALPVTSFAQFVKEQLPIPLPKEDRRFLADLATSYWEDFAKQP